ncbi:Spherulation-specific family 4-domain-containing protein [Coniella lustricola]|uniref:Spherulation-specific family 4-domain-containing protein n=1 Tax=Coniella lustricola TaxID=2025994 RepID=A0A2T3AGL2_9PEZI|nr:Spherulation-specific family 4-domain-containing protein [Coniella lustricola]
MKCSTILAASLAAGSMATKLLLPLYQYPMSGVWDPVFTAIEANPNLDFQIIVNVDTGPAGSTPNSDFVTGVAKLNSYSNVLTLGYVHCSFGSASQDELSANSSDWAAWNAYSGANTSIGGLFFDETPNTEGTTSDVTFMTTAVEAAKSAFGSYALTTIFNPGAAIMHDEFWTLADYNVIFEDSASEYSDSVLTSNIPSGKAGQSAILIPDFASVGTAAEAQTWLQAMAAVGVGAANILDYDYIQATSSEGPAPVALVASALVDVVDAATSAVVSEVSVAAATSSSVAKTTSVAPTTSVAKTSVKAETTSAAAKVTTAAAVTSAAEVTSVETETETQGSPAAVVTVMTTFTTVTSVVIVTAAPEVVDSVTVAASSATTTSLNRHHHWQRAHKVVS